MLKPRIGRAWLRAFGWRTQGSIDHPKMVLIAAPHTTNWDLPFMLACAWEMGFEIRWMGKHTLFRGPLGWLMRRLGGLPVDRRGRHNMVDQAVDLFRQHDRLILAVPPEGTRSRADHWKSGFYHIARAADVPIALGFLDYARKVGGIGGYVFPSGHVREDMDQLRAFYRDVRGKYPAKESDIRLRDEGDPASG